MVPISVNGVPITEREIAVEMQFHPARAREEAFQQAAIALAIRALLNAEVARLQIEPPTMDAHESTEEAAIRALLVRELKVPEPDEAACRRHHAANRRRFRGRDLYEAAHILFPAAPKDAAARAQAREAAQRALAELQAAPARFAELARAHSACSSSAEGGRLGQLSPGDLVEEVETFIMALEEGQICPVPVMSRYGAHVLRLDRRASGVDLPYEAVADAVRRHLTAHAWQRAVSQYLRILAGRARIEGIDLGGAATPLVQ